MRNFITIMNDVIDYMNLTEVTPINFIHGEYTEVVKILQEQDKSSTKKFTKYPLIVLFEPFEQVESEIETVDSVVTCNLAIVTPSNMTDRSEKRNTDNYIAILDPLFELLMLTIRRSRGNWFQIPPYKQIPYTRTNVMFNGQDSEGKNQNILSSIVDAIEIKSLQLNLVITKNKNY